MTQQSTSMPRAFDRLRQGILSPPALPPPRLTANVYETVDGDAFIVEIPVPGLSPDEIEIEVTTSTLTVSTHPKRAADESNRRYLQQGRPPMPLSRVIEFPVEIDTDNVQPTLEYGYLKIHVPKAESGRRRVIRLDQMLGRSRSGGADQPAESPTTSPQS